MLNIQNDSVITAEDDIRFMQAAIRQAYIAEENGDVPVGTVIVHQGKIIAKAYNQRQLLNDPTAHAEILALTAASQYLSSWRLHGCTIYVTLEPCSMCAGALVLARMDRLVFGCRDPKTGACGSLYNIVQDERLNHSLDIRDGVLENDCSQMLSNFFQQRRLENKSG